MWIVLLHADPLFVPRFDLVPVLVAVRAGDVIRACPAAPPVSPAVPQPHAAAVSLLHRSSRASADEGRRFDPAGAAAGEPVQAGHGHGHRLLVAAAIVVELQSFADFCHQRVHFFGAHGDGLLQKDVVLLPTGHRGEYWSDVWMDAVRVFVVRMNESRGAAPRSHHAARH